jgi:glyoxylase-like metal-dependent hydrolase (beta-lactamase superfamily II)
MDTRGGGVIEPREPDEQDSLADLRAHYDVELVRAPNPGPLTLSGTNSWVVRRSPAWVVDPGPLLEQHLAALYAAIDARGGLGGVALTHDHHDHSEAARTVAEHYGARAGGARSTSSFAKERGWAPSRRSSRQGTPPTTSR